jgi:hypothetical protein
MVEKDDSGRAATRPLVSGNTTPGDRGARGAPGGADNSSWVGVTSCGEAATAVWV